MAKRKKSTTKSSSNFLKYIAITLAIIVLMLGSLVAGYYFGYEEAKDESVKKATASLPKQIKKQEKKSVNTKLKQVLKKEIIKKKVVLGASHEYEATASSNPPSRIKKVIHTIKSQKAKLAIIIDDVSVKSQVNSIKKLGLTMTMSFLPPSKYRPNSAKLASKENFYMVHLPMEAQNFSAEEPITLRVGDSQKVITDRVLEIKKLFPKVRYINNHTGSKFTSNEIAVNKLIYALNSNNISFIDSRTTAKTKVPKVLKNFGLKYLGRDVFLDHHTDKAYIKKQIKRAIKIAKTEGSAIAIGHPHANTLKALAESKNLFKDVDLVYINKIY